MPSYLFALLAGSWLALVGMVFYAIRQLERDRETARQCGDHQMVARTMTDLGGLWIIVLAGFPAAMGMFAFSGAFLYVALPLAIFAGWRWRSAYYDRFFRRHVNGEAK